MIKNTNENDEELESNLEKFKTFVATISSSNMFTYEFDKSGYYYFLKQYEEEQKRPEEKISDFLNDAEKHDLDTLKELKILIEKEKLESGLTITYEEIYKKFSRGIVLNSSKPAREILLDILKMRNTPPFKFIPMRLDAYFFNEVMDYYIERLTYNNLVRMPDDCVENLKVELNNSLNSEYLFRYTMKKLKDKISNIIFNEKASKSMLAKFDCFYDLKIFEHYISMINSNSKSSINGYDMKYIIKAALDGTVGTLEYVNDLYDKLTDFYQKYVILRVYKYCADELDKCDEDTLNRSIANILKDTSGHIFRELLDRTSFIVRVFSNENILSKITKNHIAKYESNVFLKLIDHKAVKYSRFKELAEYFEFNPDKDLEGYALEKLDGVSASDIEAYVRKTANNYILGILDSYNLNVDLEDFDFNISLKDKDTIDLKLEILK